MASVLIIEEDHELRSAVSRDLRQRGHRVRAVAGAPAAALALSEASVDAVVASLPLLELEPLLGLSIPPRRWVVGLPVLSPTDVARLRHVGALVLVKPFTPDELADAVTKAATPPGSGTSDMVDLLLHQHRLKRSACLSFANGGLVVIENGELIHANHGDADGLLALSRVLALGSDAKVRDFQRPLQASLRGPFMMLIFRALRELDENERRRGS